MGSFRSAKSQAEYAIKQMLGIGTSRHQSKNDYKIHSLGTARNYRQALIHVTEWLKANRLNALMRMTTDEAIHYLEWRSESIGQKTLDQERQAIQLHLKQKLPVIKSELAQELKSRAYTSAQIKLVTVAQAVKYQLATQLAQASGLRAHELLTLKRKNERIASSHRHWSSQRFIGREGIIYTVIGKGGLIREVLIPTELAQQLEQCRLTQPKLVKDRMINYHQHYNIGGGKAWSNSFSAASKRELGWSHGAHGLRHTYAQQRMDELQQRGFFYQDALAIVSQELGHFRPEITEVYLR